MSRCPYAQHHDHRSISVKDLAESWKSGAKDLISRLLARGVFATINQTLDAELAGETARFFGAETNVITFENKREDIELLPAEKKPLSR